MLFGKKHDSVWLGLGAGLAGGLAGSVVLGKFAHYWDGLTASDTERKGMESTVKAASEASEKVLDRELTPQEKKPAASMVHFGFGGLMGALYGLTVAKAPVVSTAAGAPFGAAVYLGAHAAAVPALGLAEPPTKVPLKNEVGEFLGHLVFGLVTDATRRGVIAAVKAM